MGSIQEAAAEAWLAVNGEVRTGGAHNFQASDLHETGEDGMEQIWSERKCVHIHLVVAVVHHMEKLCGQ